jgi:hypothetical protein
MNRLRKSFEFVIHCSDKGGTLFWQRIGLPACFVPNDN